MSYRELYSSISNRFMGSELSFDVGNFIVLGVPFDGTVTYRPGSRFAPMHLREASNNVETFSFRSLKDARTIKLADIGDLHVVQGNSVKTLERLSKVVGEIYRVSKIPILLGGEHLITLGSVKPLKKTTIIIFDAHFDLRESYLGEKLSHATVTRRIAELVGNDKIILVGVRAGTREEYEFAKQNITFFTSYDIHVKGATMIGQRVRKALEGAERVYISIDLDVLDPCYAPGVGSPEPEGLNLTDLLNILWQISENTVGIDITEYSPLYDLNGITAVNAVKILYELVCNIIYPPK
ncbi:MAG: agmatinase [Candidatus Odinarchaeia archaeon]